MTQTDNPSWDHQKWEREKLPKLVDDLLLSYRNGFGLNALGGLDLPQHSAVICCLKMLLAILFPGFQHDSPVRGEFLHYRVGDMLHNIHDDLIREVERAIRYGCRKQDCNGCDPSTLSLQAVNTLLEQLPIIRDLMRQDVQRTFNGDPAAVSYDEILLSYPGIQAVAINRLAHILYKQAVPLIPRMWSEYAHYRTGIDINPGAELDAGIFIDHGTGVVIGETAKIGKNVAIYQGVTLGALAPIKGQSLAGHKRHPTIEDNVVIYAGATILGGDTIIGHDSVIGGNVWITRSVPPQTTVILDKTELRYLTNKKQDG